MPYPNHRFARSLACLVALATMASLPLHAQSVPAASTSASSTTSMGADNTRMNQRDRSGQTATPASQPNDKADIKLAAAVRRAVVKDKSLSMLAHNVKIVAVQGAMTLRGPVRTADEKAQVETVVKGVSGVNSVDNELDVKQ